MIRSLLLLLLLLAVCAPLASTSASPDAPSVEDPRLVRPVVADLHWDGRGAPEAAARAPALPLADALLVDVPAEGLTVRLRLSRNEALLAAFSPAEGRERPEHCYYHGSVAVLHADEGARRRAGVDEGWEAGGALSASTCGGSLDAHFRVGRLAFLLKPARPSHSRRWARALPHPLFDAAGAPLLGDHVMLLAPPGPPAALLDPPVRPAGAVPPRPFGRTAPAPPARPAPAARPARFHPMLNEADFPSVVELVVATDRSMYVRYLLEPDATLEEHTLRLVNHADRLLQGSGLGVRLLLRAVDHWEFDQADMSGSGDAMLASLRDYGRAQQGGALSHDMMAVIGAWASPIGRSYSPSAICADDPAADGLLYSVVRDWDQVDAAYGDDLRDSAATGATLAHEISHGLGVLSHTGEGVCAGVAEQPEFIMNAGISENSYLFSDCAKDQMRPHLEAATSCLCRTCLVSATAAACLGGFYDSSPGSAAESRCLPCSDSCAECEGSASRCTRCPSGRTLYDGACVDECPAGTWERQPPVVRIENSPVGVECKLCSDQTVTTCPSGQFVTCPGTGTAPFACASGAGPPSDCCGEAVADGGGDSGGGDSGGGDSGGGDSGGGDSGGGDSGGGDSGGGDSGGGDSGGGDSGGGDSGGGDSGGGDTGGGPDGGGTDTGDTGDDVVQDPGASTAGGGGSGAGAAIGASMGAVFVVAGVVAGAVVYRRKKGASATGKSTHRPVPRPYATQASVSSMQTSSVGGSSASGSAAGSTRRLVTRLDTSGHQRQSSASSLASPLRSPYSPPYSPAAGARPASPSGGGRNPWGVRLKKTGSAAASVGGPSAMSPPALPPRDLPLRRPAPVREAAPASEWTAHLDEESGHTYWWSELRGESTWTRPEGAPPPL